MKTLFKITLFITLLSLVNCDNRSGFAVATEITYKDGIAYHESEPFTGTVEKWTSGYKEQKNHYVDGKKNGVEVVYAKGGDIKYKAYYSDGKLDGVYTKYYPPSNRLDRVVASEKTYSDGKLDGVYKEYDTNGDLKIETTFKNNIISDSIILYENDKKTVVHQSANGVFMNNAEEVYWDILTYSIENKIRSTGSSKIGDSVSRCSWYFDRSSIDITCEFATMTGRWVDKDTDYGNLKDLKISQSPQLYDSDTGEVADAYYKYSIIGKWVSTIGAGADFILAMDEEDDKVKFHIFGDGNWEYRTSYYLNSKDFEKVKGMFYTKPENISSGLSNTLKDIN